LEIVMKTLAYAGALVLSFVLGSVTTLVGVPRYHQFGTVEPVATISPEELHHRAGPMPETVVDNYF
jgi:hypothetical protein